MIQQQVEQKVAVKETVVKEAVVKEVSFDQALLEKAVNLGGVKAVTLALQGVISKVEKSAARIAEKKKIIKINYDKGTIALVNLGFVWIDKQGKRQVYKTLADTPERKEELSIIRSKYGITKYDEKDKPIYMNAEGNVIIYPPVTAPEPPKSVAPIPVQTTMLKQASTPTTGRLGCKQSLPPVNNKAIPK